MKSLSIKIPNVSESLESKLEILIMGGVFWPDRPLTSERKLAEEFDVSRTSMRNALGNLCSKGMLESRGKRYYVTNVMADILTPEFREIASKSPEYLLEYWLILFGELVQMSARRGRNSDNVQLHKCAITLKQGIASEHSSNALAAFDDLCRAICDNCYNFLLSQTHFALFRALLPAITISFDAICSQPDENEGFARSLCRIGKHEFDSDSVSAALSIGLQCLDKVALSTESVSKSANPHQLIDVTLRHAMSFESVYELRLITEQHAARQAALHATKKQLADLESHLEKMSLFTNISPSEYSKLDTELHYKIAQCTRNPVFTVIDNALAPVFSRTTNQWLEKHFELRNDQLEIHFQHGQIVEALVSRDEEPAMRAMQDHLAYVLRNLRIMRQQDHMSEIATARTLLK